MRNKFQCSKAPDWKNFLKEETFDQSLYIICMKDWLFSYVSTD